jgi:hypothetical protein
LAKVSVDQVSNFFERLPGKFPAQGQGISGIGRRSQMPVDPAALHVQGSMSQRYALLHGKL